MEALKKLFIWPTFRILVIMFVVQLLSLTNTPNVNASSNPSRNFSVIMSADPQFPWTEPQLFPRAAEEEESAKLIAYYFQSMAALKSRNDMNIKAVFINGDLTAYGHSYELEPFDEMLKIGQAALNKSGPYVPVYLGLGNHDYANNIGNCALENCATRMYKYIAEREYAGMDINITKKYASIGNWQSNVVISKTYSGSLAYSVDIESVHFIQLHNYPTYTNSWWGHDESVIPNYINVTSSLDWLEQDLKNAACAKKPIVISFHDCCDHFKLDAGARRFKDLITKYNVSAVFVGHFHEDVGQYPLADNEKIYGDIPLFASGSAIHGNYNLVKFDTVANKFYVSVYKALMDYGVTTKLTVPNLSMSYDLKTNNLQC